jgi:hypothetical protein
MTIVSTCNFLWRTRRKLNKMALTERKVCVKNIIIKYNPPKILRSRVMFAMYIDFVPLGIILYEKGESSLPNSHLIFPILCLDKWHWNSSY